MLFGLSMGLPTSGSWESGPRDLGHVLKAVDAEFGLAPGAEVTTEANPESVGPTELRELRAISPVK